MAKQTSLNKWRNWIFMWKKNESKPYITLLTKSKSECIKDQIWGLKS